MLCFDYQILFKNIYNYIIFHFPNKKIQRVNFYRHLKISSKDSNLRGFQLLSNTW